MKRWTPWARYKGTKTNEAFEAWSSFAEACAFSEKLMNNPKYQCFDHWGIDVFDSKKDEYARHWWEFVNGQWEWMHQGQGIEAGVKS